MSWRGEEGGIIAARQKHKVIMTPSKRCYIDYYQESPEYAPLAIGGFLPLDSVYFYNPLPAGLTTEEQSYIIGTQANIWENIFKLLKHLNIWLFLVCWLCPKCSGRNLNIKILCFYSQVG